MVTTLTPAEMTLAMVIGGMREVTALRDGRTDAQGAPPALGFQYHILGAVGELAVAKRLNVFWSGTIGRVDAPGDVGPLQVRTGTGDTYRLCIYPRDPDGARFVLVVGLPPHVRVVGWLFGRDGKREEWWCDPTGKGRPAYFVPQAALHPLDTL